MEKCKTCKHYAETCDGCAEYFSNCVSYVSTLTPPPGFVHSRGDGWIGIDYISDSIGRTILIRRDTDLGVVDCNNMMERICRMSEDERKALVMR